MIKRTELWQVNNNADNRLGVDSLRVARKIIWKKNCPWLLKLVLFVYFIYLFIYLSIFSVTFSDIRLANSVNKSFFTSYGDLH